MKLKCRPDDFQVREISRLPLGTGPFAVYELGKRSLGTLEAVDAVCARWRLERGRVAFAGLKDKHAATRQLITIQNGQHKGLTQENLDLRYLGQAARAIQAGDIEANQFQVVVRDLASSEIEQALVAAATIAREGVPNYFDDQRFGSLGESGEFIAQPWCRGDWERTLWLILADANERDSAGEKEQKRLLRDHWGDWDACRAAALRSPWRNVLEYLSRRPSDFRGALACVRQDLRSLYLAAYQSDLWNGMLSTFLEQTLPGDQRFALPLGRRQVAFWHSLSGVGSTQLPLAALPLPSARLHEFDAAVQSLLDTVLMPEGLELRQLRVKYPRDSFFSKGERNLRLHPGELHASADNDELYPLRQRLTLQFTLPRGAYATIVIKRLLHAAESLA